MEALRILLQMITGAGGTKQFNTSPVDHSDDPIRGFVPGGDLVVSEILGKLANTSNTPADITSNYTDAVTSAFINGVPIRGFNTSYEITQITFSAGSYVGLKK